jgi:hypothetical protein
MLNECENPSTCRMEIWPECTVRSNRNGFVLETPSVSQKTSKSSRAEKVDEGHIKLPQYQFNLE